MDLFVLGAGASRGILSRDDFVPTSAEFGKILRLLKPNWETEYPALLKVVEHLRLPTDDWPLEPVWSCVDWYAKLQPALPAQPSWTGESPQLKKALLAVFGGRCDALADAIKGDATLRTILRDEVKPGDTLVSFNYDTIAERLAANVGCRLDTGPRGDARVAFAKPHGSVSWKLDLMERSIDWHSSDDTPLIDSLTPDEVGAHREPLVLGAVPIKSELIREVQHCCGTLSVYDVVAFQWRVLVEAVRDAKRIVFVGYSLPPEDVYGRFLIQEGLRLRSNPIPIQYYELEHKEERLWAQIRRVFGHLATSIEYMGPVLDHRT